MQYATNSKNEYILLEIYGVPSHKINKFYTLEIKDIMRQQRVIRNSHKATPDVIDNRTKTIPDDQVINIDPKFANLPLRCVTYVEVGEMPVDKVQLLIQELGKSQTNHKGGIHYIIPIRNGKIGTDIVFEQEFMSVVNAMCQVNESGEIVLKDGATNCHIIRSNI